MLIYPDHSGKNIFKVDDITVPEDMEVNDELITRLNVAVRERFLEGNVKTFDGFFANNFGGVALLFELPGVSETPNEELAEIIERVIGPQNTYQYEVLRGDRYVTDGTGGSWLAYSATSGLSYTGPDDLVGYYNE